MEQFKVGDEIEHYLLPPFRMTILSTQPCPLEHLSDGHLSYRVVDLVGCETWLCAHDVRKVRSARWRRRRALGGTN